MILCWREILPLDAEVLAEVQRRRGESGDDEAGTPCRETGRGGVRPQKFKTLNNTVTAAV